MSTDVERPAPIWFIRFCKWLWKKQRFFWGTVVVGILINVFSTWLFTPFSTNYRQLPIGWAYDHLFYVWGTGVVLLFFTLIVYLGNHLPEPPTDRSIEHKYSIRVIGDHEKLDLKGIPAGLLPPGVMLDDVFISLEFYPTRPGTDYPLTPEEIRTYKQRLAEVDPESEEVRDIERILLEAEREWSQRPYSPFVERVNLAAIWLRLTSDNPVAVIQGYPGAGKSTLMARLALHMARRQIGKPDPDMGEPLALILTPVQITLAKYAEKRSAEKRSQGSDLSLSTYVMQVLDEHEIPGLKPLITRQLAAGRCLVIFDGLDEVTNTQMRSEVQEQIRSFITRWSIRPEGSKDFNHFLITSRVAGYDLSAFPGYLHYLVAELSNEQIQNFLPRWCQATIRQRGTASEVLGESQAGIERIVQRQVQALTTAIAEHQGIRDLAENPLMLTLLAVMQQNGGALPGQRSELYRVVIKTLLESRNIAIGIPKIPEVQAVRCLGPLAYTMQQREDSSFVREADVLASFRQALHLQGGSPEEITEDARTFLDRIRERTGLFVKRTGDYYGFSHRTFQEYFAARHLLNEIGRDPGKIQEFGALARHNDVLWREPVKFAVGTKSGEPDAMASAIASQMIRSVLATPQDASQDSRYHDVILAAECLIEAEPFTIDRGLEREVAKQLLQVYEGTALEPNPDTKRQIEHLARRWMLSLPNEEFHPALPQVLREVMRDATRPTTQLTTLALLAGIATEERGAHAIVVFELVPLVQSFMDSSLGDGHRSADVINLLVGDVALYLLQDLQKEGPAGTMLSLVRQQVADHPEEMQNLVRHSLGNNCLLTPLRVSGRRKLLEYYGDARTRRTRSVQALRLGRGNEWQQRACAALHQVLFERASEIEIRYPSAPFIMGLSQLGDESAPSWQEACQNYLLEQMEGGSCVDYQECILLWAMLFRDEASIAKLSMLIFRHFCGEQESLRRYAQHTLKGLCTKFGEMVLWRQYKHLLVLINQLSADIAQPGVQDVEQRLEEVVISTLNLGVYLSGGTQFGSPELTGDRLSYQSAGLERDVQDLISLQIPLDGILNDIRSYEQRRRFPRVVLHRFGNMLQAVASWAIGRDERDWLFRYDPLFRYERALNDIGSYEQRRRFPRVVLHRFGNMLQAVASWAIGRDEPSLVSETWDATLPLDSLPRPRRSPQAPHKYQGVYKRIANSVLGVLEGLRSDRDRWGTAIEFAKDIAKESLTEMDSGQPTQLSLTARLSSSSLQLCQWSQGRSFRYFTPSADTPIIGFEALPVLLEALLTSELADRALTALHHARSLPAAPTWEELEQLTIVLGRLLVMVAADELVPAVESELERVIKVATAYLEREGDTRLRRVALDIIRSLPARSAPEIQMILSVADEVSNDEEVQLACSDALSQAVPKTAAGWVVLENARESARGAARDAIEARLELKSLLTT